MHAWVNERLDALEATADDGAFDALVRRVALLSREALRDLGKAAIAKSSWRHGEVARAQKLYPELAEIFVPPPGWKQRRRRRDQAALRTRQAIARKDVFHIRKIFSDTFGGQWRGADPSAEDIAAARHGLTVPEVREALKRNR
jgi:hypothetical protein